MAKMLTDNWHFYAPVQKLLVNEPVRFVLFHIIYKLVKRPFWVYTTTAFREFPCPLIIWNFEKPAPG